MNAFKLIAAITTMTISSAGFAADAPANSAAVAVAAAASASTIASHLNVPAVTIMKPNSRSRAAVHAEAVAYLKHHKSTFALQLEQYQN